MARALVDPSDGARLGEAIPEIMDATRRLLARVHAGELGVAPIDAAPIDAAAGGSARVGWL